MNKGIDLSGEGVRELCGRHHIRKLSLFGSVLTDHFRGDSDVDVLVEFQSGHSVGFIHMAGIERELSEMLGRKVDLRTPAELSPYFRDQVLEAADIQYAAT